MGTDIEAFKREQAKELAAKEFLATVEKLVPDGARVNACRLYGAVATIVFGSSTKKQPASWEQAVFFVTALPPIARAQVRAGSLSHPPRAYVEALSEAKKERWESEEEISPVMLKIEGPMAPHRGTNVILDWYARTRVGIVHVVVELGPLPEGLFLYETASTAKDWHPVRHESHKWFKSSRARLTLMCPDLHTIQDATGESLAQLDTPFVRWSSGAPEYSPSYSVLFTDLDDSIGPARSGAAIVLALAKAATPQKPSAT